MKKFLLILLVTLSTYAIKAQINISTGLAPFCFLDPNWTIYTSPTNSVPGAYPVRVSNAASFYEPAPVFGTNARWVNEGPSCSHIGHPGGSYNYVRSITVPPSSPFLNLNFRVAADDSVTVIQIYDASLSLVADLSSLIVITTPARLSLPISYSLATPTSPTYYIRVKTKTLNNTGGFLLSGYADFLSTPCAATATNYTICPCAAPLTLSGTPSGGTFSVPNPYTSPASFSGATAPVIVPYNYMVSSVGCTAISPTASITVDYNAPTIIPSSIIPTTTSVTLSCNPVSCSPCYNFWLSTTPTFSFGTTITPGCFASPTLPLGAATLLPNTKYYVRVKARYCPGRESGWSPVDSFTTLNDSCATGSCATITTATGSLITWTGCTTASNYRVWYRYYNTSTMLWTTWFTATCLPATATSLPISIPAGTQCEAVISTLCNPCPATLGNPWSPWSPVFGFASRPNVNASIEDANIKIFPNPTTDIINIELNLEKSQTTMMKMYDFTGRLLKQVQANSQAGLNNLTIDMSELANGNYIIQIFANNELKQISKVQKSN